MIENEIKDKNRFGMRISRLISCSILVSRSELSDKGICMSVCRAAFRTTSEGMTRRVVLNSNGCGEREREKKRGRPSMNNVDGVNNGQRKKEIDDL